MRLPEMMLLIGIALFYSAVAGAAGQADTPKKLRGKSQVRIVCLGDSITDGNSYPTLLHQALADAGYEPPLCLNAGVANDTSADMLARLERTVLPLHPTLVTIMAGTNDLLHGAAGPTQYAEHLTKIAERLKKDKIPLVLLTPPIYGGAPLPGFDDAVRGVAHTYRYPVAEVSTVMQAAQKQGIEQLEADHVHPNFEGHRAITRALLDALGYQDVPVPKEIRITMFPGVITGWLMRPTKDAVPTLDDTSVLAVMPDATWKAVVLPESKPQQSWWSDCERRRGFALSFPDTVGVGSGYQGVAKLSIETPKKVYFNTGAALRTIWLNGHCLFKKNESMWTGWHAGKERIPAELRAGENTIVIEMGSQFFLSVTDGIDW